MVKLLACSRCKSLYYCSRECQKADWPLHKNIINMNQHIERLSLTDPSAAQKAKHWLEWQMSIDSWAYASALRLQKNPGRAHTHLVLEKSVYTPDAGPLATDKFTIVGCTVLRIADMLGHIELGMKLGPGEGAGLCMSVLQDRREVGPGNPLIPFLIIRLDGGIVNMSLGRGLHSLLTYCSTYAHPLLVVGFVATKQLEETEYNPNWRQDVNKARPPPPKFQYRNCRDAEFD
ncbi:uncharacterized protein B0H18DRAFT_892152 [Fomitopsis serialis]|uniref:uncharacterized protein n=1 Tax=Fomitopsis serialis TaxID=139415 RepID=UPI002007C017|nr:uncharacterized protein B0H18DRAFT_892152 [Neoantrodia serialis]KAH9911647.1 hypothetical protein B0H18DRAFT_892152 [Neoantrodia serialis]